MGRFLPQKNRKILILIEAFEDGKVNIVSGKGILSKGKVTRPDRFLHLIDALLFKNKKTIDDLKAILITTGPGRFSLIRGAAVTANTLSFACNIPLIKVPSVPRLESKELVKIYRRFKKVDFVVPFYGKEPHVSL